MTQSSVRSDDRNMGPHSATAIISCLRRRYGRQRQICGCRCEDATLKKNQVMTIMPVKVLRRL